MSSLLSEPHIITQINPHTQYSIQEYSNYTDHQIITLDDLFFPSNPHIFNHLKFPSVFYNAYGVRYGYLSEENRVCVELSVYIDAVFDKKFDFFFTPGLPFLEDRADSDFSYNRPTQISTFFYLFKKRSFLNK